MNCELRIVEKILPKKNLTIDRFLLEFLNVAKTMDILI